MRTWEFVLLLLAVVSVLVYLATRSGERYSQKDAGAHATEYAGIVKEAHGPLTVFLIVGYILLISFLIVYLYLHWPEFKMMRMH